MFNLISTVLSLPATLEKLVSTQTQLAENLIALTGVVGKIKTETQGLIDRVNELTVLVEAGQTVTPEVRAALDALTAQVNVVDALVPDAAAPAPEVPVDPAPVDPAPADPVPETPADPAPETPVN